MCQVHLSVIIPLFNSEFYIRDCLNSIFIYPTKNMEILLINDGSTDSTLEICREYELKYENIVIINLEKNKGIAYARNIGIKNSNGKYIAFIDSDDYIKNDMLNKLLFLIENNNIDIVMCTSDAQLPDGTTYEYITVEDNFYNKILSTKDMEYILKKRIEIYYHVHGKIYKKELFNNISFNINFGEDELTNLIIMKTINSFYILNEKLYMYRISADSISTQKLNPKIILEKKEALSEINKIINDIELLNKINFGVIDGFMVQFLLEYQNSVFYTMIYNEEFSKEQTFILYGASSLGKEYMSILERYGYSNIIFVDNDINKQNTYIRKHKIISIDELKNTKKDTDILIISSQYFVYILKQLLDNKIINNISEILISKNNTEIKQALIEFFKFALKIDVYINHIAPTSQLLKSDISL